MVLATWIRGGGAVVVSTEGLTLFGAGSEWFWSMLQFVVVAITLVGIYFQLRQGRASIAFTQANALEDEWDGERLTRRRLAIALALRDNGPDVDLRLLAPVVESYWEKVGALVRSGHIELPVVADSLGAMCRLWWTILEPDVRRWQAAESSETWANFEWLAGATTRIQRAQGVPDAAFSRERMEAMVPLWISAAQMAIEEFESMRSVTRAPSPVEVLEASSTSATAADSAVDSRA
jgi:hypothetical protein